jgi:DeoR/GlpR family transcriptional regulator of sugar metabolism
MEENHQESFDQAEHQVVITNPIHKHGSLLADQPAAQFGASRITVYSRLNNLERQEALRKVHSCAATWPAGSFELDRRDYLPRHRPEKVASNGNFQHFTRAYNL